MTYISAPHSACAPRRPLRLSLFTRLQIWKQRRDLAKLDDRALEDIGLSRAEAEREAKRPLWDAPRHWQR
jgi:uncharacterized protein YjiS (DUF1127 family)